MNKILGGTVNTTDNQVTAQVKAEPTVAQDATLTAATEGEQKQTRHAALLAKVVRANKQLVKVQHANAVLQILVQVRIVVVLIRLVVQILVAMSSKVKNVQNVNHAKLVHHAVNVVKIRAIRVLILLVAMAKMVKIVTTTGQITVPQTAIIKRSKWN